MSLMKILQKELNSLIAKEYSFGAEDFPVDTLLEYNHSVEWVAQNFIDLHLVNVYCVKSPNETTEYIATLHSDGGVIVFHAGPWKSLAKAKAAFGSSDEEWTDL